jgi:hypothetical protein
VFLAERVYRAIFGSLADASYSVEALGQRFKVIDMGGRRVDRCWRGASAPGPQSSRRRLQTSDRSVWLQPARQVQPMLRLALSKNPSWQALFLSTLFLKPTPPFRCTREFVPSWRRTRKSSYCVLSVPGSSEKPFHMHRPYCAVKSPPALCCCAGSEP